MSVMMTTYEQLAVGDRFRFVGDNVLPNLRPVDTVRYRVKDDDRAYTTTFEDGSVLAQIGVRGSQRVRRILEAAV